MLYVGNDGSIQLTRGDTARFSVTINNEIDGSNYDILDDDTLKLTVKKNVTDTEPILQKVITGSSSFHIEPNDTKNVSFGKYIYDVELTTSSGDVYTVIVPNTFEILKEVTF